MTTAAVEMTKRTRTGSGVKPGDIFVTRGSAPLARRYLEVVEGDGVYVLVRSIARVEGWSADGMDYACWPVRGSYRGTMTFRRAVRGRVGASARPTIKVSGTVYELLDNTEIDVFL